jgi:hypothetical protein
MLTADRMFVRKSPRKSDSKKCIKFIFNNRPRLYFNFIFYFGKDVELAEVLTDNDPKVAALLSTIIIHVSLGHFPNPDRIRSR